MNKQNRILILIGIATLVLGIFIGRGLSGKKGQDVHDEATHASEEQIYTCSMHPSIRSKEPGNCPICGMELIPLIAAGQTGDMAVTLTAADMKIANIRTMVIGDLQPERTVRLDGKVEIDERSVHSQVGHFPGRVEKLLVNYTGEYVSRGQTIALVYSPELMSAQKELLEAHKVKETQPMIYKAARSKLQNWKLSDSEIDKIIATGTLQDLYPLKAEGSGYVSRRNINVGDYIRTGSVIYEFADLSRVWVLFNLHESDLAWVKKGDEITFRVSSYPGKEFKSRIAFIDPVIDPRTRVAMARVEMPNADGSLKPEMFVTGEVKSELEAAGTAIGIPKSAVMWTGSRSIVYVRTGSAESYAFEMREVELGPPMSDQYIVKTGLQKGDEVVVNGTFSVDAAAQLAGKPSMMDPKGERGGVGSHSHGDPSSASPSPRSKTTTKLPADKRKLIRPVFEAYLELKEALTKDDVSGARLKGKNLLQVMNKTDFGPDGMHKIQWEEFRKEVLAVLEHIEHQQDIESIRNAFWSVSKLFIHYAETTRAYDGTIYVQYCPMADGDKGASWLSTDSAIRNPYFGGKMPACGEVVNKINH